MPETINGVATTAIPNYSGVLYRRGNTETPMLAIIGGRSRLSNSYRFVTGQEYSIPDAEIPSISERKSLTAPEPVSVTRAQDYNVTQIFQTAVGSSYFKEASMGALSGVNNAGQAANPVSELSFQITAAMRKLGTDIEKTMIQGKYHEATSPEDANQTRGLVEAIRSNVFDLGGVALSMWDLAELMTAMGDEGAILDGLVLWCDSKTLFQLCAEAEANSIRPMDFEVNGIKITRITTPVGDINLRVGRYLPSGTALLLNLSVLSAVEQNTPGKGNFFYEELAKTGAGTNGQVFGLWGLDYGPEFYHGKITGIQADFVRPKKGITVNVGGVVPTVDVLPEISGVKITETRVNGIGYKTEYTGIPTSDPTEKVEYLVSTNPVTGFNPVDAITASMVGKFLKVRVTASGTATGTATSASKRITGASANVTAVSVTGDVSAATGTVAGSVTLDKSGAKGSVEVHVSKAGKELASTTVDVDGEASVDYTVTVTDVAQSDTLTIEAIGNSPLGGVASTTTEVKA